MRRILACLAGALLTVPATVALAHSFAPAVLDLRERDVGVFDVTWKLPGPDSGSLVDADGQLMPEFPSVCRRLDPGGAANSDDVISIDGRPVYWRIDCGAARLHGASLSISRIDGSRVDALVRITWQRGETATAVLRSGAGPFVVPAERGLGAGAPARAVLWSYGRLGVEHIWLGFDHLLFVLGLLLLVDTWAMLVKTISAFTLAHTLTLALAVLGVLHVPTAPVEALIALSIVLVALELTRAPESPPTLSRQYPWVVAFSFGLLHGLGFAGALVQIGLPPDQVPLALLAFNLGVEAGQLLFVAAMIAPVLASRRITASWSHARLVPAYAIGALATAWVFERIYALTT